MPAMKRVRVGVPRLPGHLIEFGMDAKVTLYGPKKTYTATPLKDGESPATVASELVDAVAGRRL